jgi:hypothetical protein
MNEIEVKRPSALDVKAHNTLKKIVSIIDNNPKINIEAKSDLLIKIVDILGKHGYNEWLNSGIRDKNTSIEQFLKSLTNEQLIDIIEKLDKIKSSLFEIKINSPTNFIFVPDALSLKNPGTTTHKLHGHFSGKLYWMGKLITDRATVRYTYTDTSFGPKDLQLALSKEKYDELDPNAKKKLIKSALSSNSIYVLYLDSENFAVNEKS